MFAKIWASSLLVLALSLQVAAHAGVAPALGVQGTLTRGDVQRPSAAKPCGKVDIASKIGSSTAVAADASGSFKVDATCFNGGTDGSLKFKAKVDPTGTGKESGFVDMVITTNGNNSPPKAETLPITAQLPSGIKCTDNKCLVQFISGAGFGNCVVVTQSGAASTGGVGNSSSSNSTVGGNSTVTQSGAVSTGGTRNTDVGNSSSSNSTVGGNSTVTYTAAGCSSAVGAAKRSVGRRGPGTGSHMARLLLAELRNRGEGAVEIAK